MQDKTERETSSKALEVGVFVPLVNDGWICSRNGPATPGTFDEALDAVLRAEAMNFDVALSGALWRGFGGPTHHNDFQLESLTSMAAIAQATSRIAIWATVHMMIWPPAIVAKIAATIDQISGGRFGMNLVTGANPIALGQMGLWRELDHEQRYQLGEEWIALVKRLWTEEHVTHKGEFYETTDCMSNPKPKRLPPVICAGQSERGFRFTVENCSATMLVGADSSEHIGRMKLAKKIAREHNRNDFKTYGLVSVLPGTTDREAQDRLAWFNEGIDLEALANRAVEYGKDVSIKVNQGAQHFLKQEADQSAVMPGTLVGSPDTLAKRIATAVNDGELDGIMLIVPDYRADLDFVGREVLPRLRDFGIVVNVGG